MKRFPLFIILALVPMAGFGQALLKIPPPSAFYYSTDGSGAAGTWAPMTGGGTGALSNIPPPVGAYCSSDGTGNAGTWVPCANGGGGGGGGASVSIEHIYTSPGSFNFPHNLGTLTYQIHCYTKAGGTNGPASWTDFPADSSNATVTVPAAGDYVCSFNSATAVPADFNIATVPTSQTFQPTMTGTQQPTFAVNQTAFGGYSGTVTYSTSGLASGMTGAYSPTTITGTGSNTLTLSFPANQTPATTSFTVSGTDGTKTHTANPSITVGNINSGLIECWAMNDGGSSTTFADSCGTSNTETKQAGTFTWATNSPLPGSTATFSSTAYATGANQTQTNFDGTTAFSFSTWVKFSDLSTFRTVLSTLDPAASFKGWELGTNTAPVQFNVWLANAIGSNALETLGSTVLATNTLYYVVFTYDGSRTAAGAKLYVNGVLETSTHPATNLTASIANTKSVAIGARPDGSTPFGGGIIAYTRIYNRVLSSTDVANYYAAGAR